MDKKETSPCGWNTPCLYSLYSLVASAEAIESEFRERSFQDGTSDKGLGGCQRRLSKSRFPEGTPVQSHLYIRRHSKPKAKGDDGNLTFGMGFVFTRHDVRPVVSVASKTWLTESSSSNLHDA